MTLVPSEMPFINYGNLSLSLMQPFIEGGVQYAGGEGFAKAYENLALVT